MDEYKKTPLWKNAYELGREVHELTKRAHPANTILRLLRESSEGLSIITAIYLQDSDKLGCAESIKEVFNHAHEAEGILFMSLFFRHLSADKTGDLFTRLHAIKRDLVAALAVSLNG
ncbi:MAG: hypothetical protein PHW12_01565 [Smithella sp.]|nr:hypothetical protein [Smithella sp.]MDD5672857.1 hypothetical protein [Chitinivibrionales bacterium]